MRLRLFFSLRFTASFNSARLLPWDCNIGYSEKDSCLFFQSRSLFSAEENPAIGNVFIFYVSRDGKIPEKMCLFVLPSPLFLPPSCPLPSAPSPPPPPPFPSVPFLLKKYLFFVFGREVGRGLQLGVNEKSNGTRPLWTGNLDHARHAFRCVNKATLNKT